MAVSIIEDPGSWSIPDDVRTREREKREGIAAYRRQRQEEEDRRKNVARPILTPEPAFRDSGFTERYALHVDTATGEPFLISDPDGHVTISDAATFGMDDDPES